MQSRSIALLLCITAFRLYAEPSETTESETPKKNYFAAVVTAETSNLLLFLNNRYLGSSDFADASPESINENIHSQWQWDQSVFSINEFGHPYQGSFYFNSGRANGLNFYESAALTMLGSATWEITCERSTPSLNDLITTTSGGAAFGEMFHRLYLEALAENNPVVAALISPTDAITNAINKQKPTKTEKNLRELILTSGFGYQLSQKDNPIPGDSQNIQSDANLVSTHGLSLVYGDPYAHTTTTPYSQFDMNVDVFLGPEYWQFTYFTDGFLLSTALKDDSSTKSTLGLTLNYDVILGNNNTFGGTALDLTYKMHHFYGENTENSLSAHAGWLMLGSSQYYHPINEPVATDYEELNNYGTGLNTKVDYAISHATLGKVELSAAAYYMWIVPNSAPQSKGTLGVLRTKTEYSHPIGPNSTLGIANVATMNFSRQDQLPDNTKISNATTIFIRSSLQKKSDTTNILVACRNGILNTLKGLNRSFKESKIDDQQIKS
jgi:hypothetical protein